MSVQMNVAGIGLAMALFAALTLFGIKGIDAAEQVQLKYEFAPNIINEINLSEYTCKDCNVIVISIDTLNKYHLPCYGYEKNTSPTICEFAKRGIMFDNFIAHAALTPVSQMSIFSSQYPSISGLVSFFSDINNETPYLPKILQNAGYDTAHIGSSPEFHVVKKYNQSALKPMHIGQNRAFARGFDEYEVNVSREVPQEAINWISKSNSTFFLWISIGTVHHPYIAYPTKGLPEIPASEFFEMKLLIYETLARIYQGKYYDGENYDQPVQLKEDDLTYIQGTYDSTIYHSDKFIRQLLDTLQNKSLLNNTVIIIHGIHGEDLGEHGYFGHYDIFDTEANNLLIIYSPTINQTNARIERQVQGIDIAPTILEMLGFEKLTSMQGTNIFSSENINASEYAFIERIPLWEESVLRFHWNNESFEYGKGLYGEFFGLPKNKPKYRDTAVRTNEWKLIHRKSMDFENKLGWYSFLSNNTHFRTAEYELYDLRNDPLEQENVVKRHPEIVADLKERLLEFEKSTDKE